MKELADIKRIVFITIDSLRFDYIRAYNEKISNDISPTINNLSDSSIIFDKAFSQGPYTRAAFSAIFFSSYLSKVAQIKGGKMERGRIKAGRKSWVELLNQEGFNTAGLTTNPFTGRMLGYQKGFDYFDDRDRPFTFTSRKLFPKLDKKLKALFIDRIKKRYFSNGSMDSPYINSLAKRWLDRNVKNNFMIWLHYMDVHTPYWNNLKPPKEFKDLKPGQTEELKRAYRQAINHVDSSIAEILKYLKDKKIDKETALIITSDHGEYFGEHKQLAHPGEYYEQSIRVPLIVYHPKIRRTIIDRPVELTDIGPTILELAEEDLSGKYSSDGFNLLKLTESESKYPKKYIIGETFSPLDDDEDYHPSYYVRGKRYKLIVFPAQDREELYDLKEDPQEKNNIAKNNQKVIEKMKRYFKQKIND
jgi:arylsulfatase A-like enzyme